MASAIDFRKWGVAAASLIVVGLCAWWLWPSSAAPEPPARVERREEPPRSEPKPAENQLARADYLPNGQPIYPAGSAVPEDAHGMAPHGLSPTHLRIYRENNLVGNLNGAMDVKDVAGMRDLLRQYREEYPEDAHVMQQGYELIANCIEHPGGRNREVAQRYYDEELDSGLRRYIRRYCLEN